jgi:hypothetical protein
MYSCKNDVKILFLLHRFFINCCFVYDFNVLVVSTQKSKVRFYLGQTYNRYAPPIPQPCSNSPSPIPPPHNKVKTTLGKKVARSPPAPNPTATLPPPTSALPPSGTGSGGEIRDTDQGQSIPRVRI